MCCTCCTLLFDPSGTGWGGEDRCSACLDPEAGLGVDRLLVTKRGGL